ncbi:MAG: EscN/YscN/HrcN family type III secretion system ATPase [Chitinivibrionales bacterium]|nr:EscN/YscN/HrcN family type III secretion system ATPase [Chitinivibrionales bacterium]MBD3356593.1 EscN/YscN/HrcN family type III secretion system ATPase [Chitinivibrionales bacterium]
MREYTVIEELNNALSETRTLVVKGRVIQVVGTLIKAEIPSVRIGEICYLVNALDGVRMEAEVVGFSKNAALLTPVKGTTGLCTDMDVIPTREMHRVPVGDELLGRVLDGLGRPLDEDTKGALKTRAYYPVYAEPPNPLNRRIISQPMPLGVRAIDGLLTCGEGQRIGIFAAAGGGKTSLLSMIINAADADVRVIALIGERGREVREFLDVSLGKDALAKSVLVVSTSDRSPIERMKGAYVATAIAEYFRDRGKRVLFIMDSVTRFARAVREIGLAAGEPPARRGFPPSVFSTLPKLMERCGPSEKGAITALYTVLVEGDDMTEPVADEARSILDGHIILSRKLAASNHYPAIDILESASRVMNAVVPARHADSARKFRNLLAKYKEIELLVQLGEYKKGTDPEADEALEKAARLNEFLKQGLSERTRFDASISKMISLVETK